MVATSSHFVPRRLSGRSDSSRNAAKSGRKRDGWRRIFARETALPRVRIRSLRLTNRNGALQKCKDDRVVRRFDQISCAEVAIRPTSSPFHLGTGYTQELCGNRCSRVTAPPVTVGDRATYIAKQSSAPSARPVGKRAGISGSCRVLWSREEATGSMYELTFDLLLSRARGGNGKRVSARPMNPSNIGIIPS